MTRCPCGCTLIEVESVLCQEADGHWVGRELTSIRCRACGRPITLSALQTVALMHRIIEEKEQPLGNHPPVPREPRHPGE
jgi:hypothetical protein